MTDATAIQADRKAWRPFAGLVLSALILAAAGFVSAFAREPLNNSLKRSLLAFAAARSLNGLISVAQGTEISAEPLGFGVTLTPGEVLDPLNDLVEDLSTVLLVSSASMAIQRFFFDVSLAFFVQATLWTTWLGFLIASLFAGLRSRPVFSRGLRLLTSIAVIRLVIPLMALLSDGVHETYLKPEYVNATRILQASADEVGDAGRLALPAEGGDPTWKGAISGWLKGGASPLGALQAKMDRYKEVADQAIGSTLNLIWIFALETVVLPLGFLIFVRALWRTLA